jgi:hypothetical protein
VILRNIFRLPPVCSVWRLPPDARICNLCHQLATFDGEVFKREERAAGIEPA